MKPGSAKHYQFDLNRHLVPALGPIRLMDLGRARIQGLLSSKRKQGYSGSTVHSIRTTLSKVLKFAVEWQYLEENPARGICIGDRLPVRELPFLMPEQTRRLLYSLSEPCRTLVLLAVLSGARIGELIALRWKRVDFLRGCLLIRESVYEGNFGTTKTRSSRRDLPMSAQMREVLIAHSARCGNTGPEDLLFTSKANTPVNPKNLLRRVLQPACRKLGLPPVTWHSFRHTHATLLAESGESLKTAQALLGHSDIQTTLNIYTHAIPESQRRAVEKVGEILFPNVPKFAGYQKTRNAN